MTGQALKTFITSLNGGASIDDTLLAVLVNTAKTILEAERPWMCLRKTDSSKSVTTANTWQTAIDISTITDFAGYYSDLVTQPIILFDGINRREYYRQIPWDRRLQYKDVSNTFCFDENSKTIYLNGVVPFNGTLNQNYIAFTDDITLTESTAIWSPFPSRFVPVLGFYAVGIHMGAVDYDTITARQSPQQLSTMTAIKNALETWDNDRQLAAIAQNDTSEIGVFPRSGAIDRSGGE